LGIKTLGYSTIAFQSALSKAPLFSLFMSKPTVKTKKVFFVKSKEKKKRWERRKKKMGKLFLYFLEKNRKGNYP